MNEKIHSGIMLTLLLMGMLTLTFNIRPATASLSVHNVDTGEDFAAIQEAIDDTDTLDGHTIFVETGTYYENAVVDKSLSLIGEDAERTFVDGSKTGYVFRVVSDYVAIRGFTIQNGAHYYPASGIVLVDCSNASIQNNYVVENGGGIGLTWASTGNVISRNNITNNGLGINVGGSYNTISENNITLSMAEGIQLVGSSHNNIVGNKINGNGWGIRSDYSSNDSIVRNQIVGSDYDGVLLVRSHDNILVENCVAASGRAGIYSYDSFGDSIFHNNFVDNSQQAISENSENTWDDGYPSGGNYWSDYKERYPDAEELDGSGIWDTPYVIDENNQDNYPLMEPWTPTPPIPTTIDELKTEIEELGSEGEIDNQGIVKSLLAKLNVAQKLVDKGKIEEAKSILEEDFIPQVQNLREIHITSEAAELLIDSAEYILSHL